MPEKGHIVAGTVGSTALRSHFGASLEDHGPNVVLYRAGPQTARRAGSLRGHDHSRQNSATPKPLHRPKNLRSPSMICTKRNRRRELVDAYHKSTVAMNGAESIHSGKACNVHLSVLIGQVQHSQIMEACEPTQVASVSISSEP
jgi:hypothetical protein